MVEATDVIRETADGQRMVAETRRKRLAERATLVARLDEIERHDAKARQPLAAKKAAADQAVLAAEKTLAAAKATALAAKRALGSHDARIATERGRIENELRATAGEVLTDFLERVHNERERLMNHRMIDERRELVTVGYNLATGPIRRLCARDNAAQLGARIKALARVQREAERLAATKADFAADLEKLWVALPTIKPTEFQ